MSKPIITVVGATSKQGGSVARSLLKSGKYHVRAVTRNVNSDESKRLASKGAELVEVPDLLNKEALLNAFSGAFGVYGMTPIIPPERGDEQFQVGKLLADTALEAGVKHFVWSSLDHLNPKAEGKFHLPDFTMKAKVTDYLHTLKGLNSTSILLAYFYSNFIEYDVPQKDADGTFVFQLPAVDPNKAYPYVDSTSATGDLVLAIFNEPDKYINKSIAVVGEEITPNEIAKTFTKVTGLPARFQSINREDWAQAGLPETLAEELYQMYDHSTKFSYYHEGRDLKESRRIVPNSLTWEQFLIETGWKGESFQEWKQRRTS